MASDSIPEEWRPVEGWPYEVSNRGRVRRAINADPRPRTRPGRVLACPVKASYRRVVLVDRDRRKYTSVHALVAAAFLPPPDRRGLHIAHYDGCSLNNHAANLRWATPAENIADRTRHGTTARGERIGNSRLCVDQISKIGEWHASGWSQDKIADALGVSQSTVSRALTGQTWTHVTGRCDYTPGGWRTSPRKRPTGL